MADTDIERAKRSRRHRKGDHSLCKPDRPCRQDPAAAAPPGAPAAGDPAPAVTPPATPAAPVEPPPARPLDDCGVPRGPRGQRLWDDMQDAGLGPEHMALLDETCRTADRLDRLHRSLERREEYLRFRPDLSGTTFTVVVDGLVSELRQTATAFKGMVTELRTAQTKASAPTKQPGAPTKPDGTPTPTGKGVLGGIRDELAARRTPATG